MDYKMGVVGLGVMGASLARNVESKGFPVVGYDLDAKKTHAFIEGPAKGKSIAGVDRPDRLMEMLERPRRVLIMVPAGAPVDSVITHLRPHLQEGDILIDGGNSLFTDTDRRSDDLERGGFRFVGAGVSGGEEGALLGPAIMPGGPREAWDALAPIFRAIAAKAEDGEPCVDYMGPRGAGHYVKMVHNGIEYGDMQLIAETYDIMRRGLGLSAAEMSEVFADWNSRDLNSYLIEVTAAVLRYVDPETGRPLVDLILDQAGQKGTGRWTSIDALELGTPIPTIDAAVWSRSISSFKAQRVAAAKVLAGPTDGTAGHDRERLLPALEGALWAAKVSSYAQGLTLLQAASEQYEYDLDLAEIARIWTGGCIIRARLLGEIQSAFKADPDLANLMLAREFAPRLNERTQGLRTAVRVARTLGVPCPAMSAALDYFDSYRQERLPANLIQAQRDYFGAHTYKRLDKPGTFHTEWTAEQADASAVGVEPYARH
jgi:6-phosphogluconate dehydrogenase